MPFHPVAATQRLIQVNRTGAAVHATGTHLRTRQLPSCGAAATSLDLDQSAVAATGLFLRNKHSHRNEIPIRGDPPMNAQTNTTWILVADNARARLFELGKRDSLPALFEIETFVNPDGRGHEENRDRLPRTQESLGSARHAIEPRTSHHDKSVDRFVGELNTALENGRVTHRYEQLVLIALPQLLGTLRAKLDQKVCAHVVAEVPHELTTMRLDEIRAYLPEAVCGRPS
jgi:protein required for attachment to host cells